MGMDPYGGGGDPTPATFWRPRESERGAYTEKKWGAETLAVWELTDLPADAVVTRVAPVQTILASISYGRFVMRSTNTTKNRTR